MSSSLPSDQFRVLIHRYLETTWQVQQAEERRDETLQITLPNENQSYEQADPDVPAPEASGLSALECRSLPTLELLQLRRAVVYAFPDAQLTIQDLLTAGEMVVARWSLRGTDLGGYDRHLPTGRVIRFTGITMMRLESLIIVEEWNEIDVIGMLRQLGIVSPSQSPRITVKRSRPVSPYARLV